MSCLGNREKLTSAFIGESTQRGSNDKSTESLRYHKCYSTEIMPYYRHGPRFKSFCLTGTERTKDLNRGLPPPAPVQCSFSCKRQSLALPVDTFNNAAKLFQQ